MVILVVLKVCLDMSGIEFGNSLLCDAYDPLAPIETRTMRESMMDVTCGLALLRVWSHSIVRIGLISLFYGNTALTSIGMVHVQISDYRTTRTMCTSTHSAKSQRWISLSDSLIQPTLLSQLTLPV